MEIEVRGIAGDYCEVKIEIDNVKISTSMLNREEAREVALLFLEAAQELLRI